MILTKEEKDWVKKMNALSAKCPSKRLIFYAMGDPNIYIVDGDHEEEIDAVLNDPLRTAQKRGWLAKETINFPSNVSAVCG